MSERPYLILNGDIPLSARIYRSGDDLTERRPAVLVTGSWLTVKEQMAHHYARALAERGYTAITLDFSGFGESGGALRQAEIPARKIADITAAARYVAGLSFVRADRVGYLAICASAQYALRAIAELVWAEGTQIDFYDQPAQVALSVDAADRHFRRTL